MQAVADPLAYNGASWAIPLWSERGTIGMLLLGPAADNSLYTQEEMEIARVTGERLIEHRSQYNTLATAHAVAAQATLYDSDPGSAHPPRAARKIEVLPLIHTAMLKCWPPVNRSKPPSSGWATRIRKSQNCCVSCP